MEGGETHVPEYWKRTSRDADTATRVAEALYAGGGRHAADPQQAIAWLETEKGVAKDLPVRDWEPESSFAGLRLTSLAAAALGAPSLAAALREASDEAGGSVDGLMSVWQVSSRN